jgi:hypothetical protein
MLQLHQHRAAARSSGGGLSPLLLAGPRPVPYPDVRGPRLHLRAPGSCRTGLLTGVGGVPSWGWWVVGFWKGRAVSGGGGWFLPGVGKATVPICCRRRPCFRSYRLSLPSLACAPPSSQWLPSPYVGHLKLAASW